MCTCEHVHLNRNWIWMGIGGCEDAVKVAVVMLWRILIASPPTAARVAVAETPIPQRLKGPTDTKRYDTRQRKEMPRESSPVYKIHCIDNSSVLFYTTPQNLQNLTSFLASIVDVLSQNFSDFYASCFFVILFYRLS